MLSTFDSQLAATAPIHDAAGNVTQAAKPNTPAANQVYVYDGWNRLTQVKETNGTVIATYEYDGRGNRIQKTTGATVRDYFHNESSQVVEVRVNNILNQTFVWDLSYVDSPVMTRRDTASDAVLDQSYYFTFDALRNVTSLINASNGNVLERYHYDAYGKVQVYNSTWTPLASSAYANITTFTGRELDAESGLYYFRARHFDPSLGRFLARDPLGYVDGMNLYSGYFVPGGVDPSGLRRVLAQEKETTEITFGSPFSPARNPSFHSDVIIENGKLRVSVKAAKNFPKEYPVILILKGDKWADHDSTQIAVRWKSPTKHYPPVTNASTLDGKQNGAEWAEDETSPEGAPIGPTDPQKGGHWDTDVPADATEVEVVLIYTDGMDGINPKKPHPDSGPQNGDVPIVAGSWTGKKDNDGIWTWKRNLGDITEPLFTDGASEPVYPLPSQRDKMQQDTDDVLENRTGCGVKSRNQGGSDYGHDIFPK